MFSSQLRSAACLIAIVLVTIFHSSPASAQSPLAPALVALAPEGTLPTALKIDVLSVIPDDAMYIVTAGNVLETKGTVERLLKKLEIPLEGDGQQKFNDLVKRLQGWDKSAVHALAILPAADGDVEPVVFVPVTNFKHFAKSIGADAATNEPSEFEIEDGPRGWIAEKAGFAVLVQKSERDLLTRIQESRKSIAKPTESIQPWISKQQIAGVALPSGVRKTLDDGIKGIEAIKTQFPAGVPQAEMVTGVFDMYADVLKTARDEVGLLAVGVRLDDATGVDFALRAGFKADGKFAAAAKDVATLPPQPLQGLPEGEFFVAGAGVFPEGWTKLLLDFALGMSAKLPKEAGGYNLTPEQIKEFVEASQQTMAGIKYLSGSMSITGQSLYDGMHAVFKTADSAKFLDTYEQAIKRTVEIAKKNPQSRFPDQQIARRKIDGRDVLVMTTDMSKVFENIGANQPPQLKGMMEAMLGKQAKVTAYVTAIDNETVVMAYTEEGLKKIAADVKDGKTGLAGDLFLKKTAAMLPKDAHWVGYLAVGGYVAMIKKTLDAALGANGIQFPFQIPQFPDAPPLGASARMGPSFVEGHIVVPIALMEAIRDYVNQVKAQFGAQQ